MSQVENPSSCPAVSNTQVDPGRKTTILGGDNIGHCEKKVHINMCLILNVYPHTAVRIFNLNAIFAQELQSALRLTVEFPSIYCELKKVYNFCAINLLSKY